MNLEQVLADAQKVVTDIQALPPVGVPAPATIVSVTVTFSDGTSVVVPQPTV